MVTTRPPKTIVKPTALGPVANTDTKFLIYGLFQKGRVLAQDGLLHPLKDADRRDLMEVIEERAERGSTLIATQLPVKQWHTAIGDPNHADALCDRILHRAHRITLKGASLRKTKSAPETTTGDT